MHRKDFLKMIGGTAAALSIPKSLFSFSLRGNIKRPNILWIVTEDINDDLGCYGDKYSYTPNLDKLANEGVRFTNVFDHSLIATAAWFEKSFAKSRILNIIRLKTGSLISNGNLQFFPANRVFDYDFFCGITFIAMLNSIEKSLLKS